MTWTVIWAPSARKDLKRLDKQTALRVAQTVGRLADSNEGDVKRLQGIEPPEWRLRVGRWRVRFCYEHDASILRVLRVLSRGDAYR